MMVILAENQAAIANALHRCEAAILVGKASDEYFEARCLAALSELMMADGSLKLMSGAAADVTDGMGSDDVVRRLVGT